MLYQITIFWQSACYLTTIKTIFLYVSTQVLHITCYLMFMSCRARKPYTRVGLSFGRSAQYWHRQAWLRDGHDISRDAQEWSLCFLRCRLMPLYYGCYVQDNIIYSSWFFKCNIILVHFHKIDVYYIVVILCSKIPDGKSLSALSATFND